MALNEVRFVMPLDNTTKVNGNHNVTLSDGKIKLTAEGESEAGLPNRYDEFSAEIEVPILLPDNVTVTNFISNIRAVTPNENEGYNATIVLGNTQYDINNTALIGTLINDYKAQYNSWPSIIIRVGTWLYVASGKEASYDITVFSPTIICLSEGREVQIRPVADVNSEHYIPGGFTGVYQLLNDAEADDDYTEIKSGISGTTYTSTVLMGSVSRPSLIQQLRLVSKIIIGYGSSVDSTVDFKVTAKGILPNGNDAVLDAKQTSNIVFSENYAWETNSYYTYVKSVLNTNEFVAALNSYFAKYHKLPQLEIEISTTGGSNTEKDTEAECKVSQVYLEMVLDKSLGFGIFDKVDGLYKAATVAYKKNGGTWTEISENECKEILKNNTIRRG